MYMYILIIETIFEKEGENRKINIICKIILFIMTELKIYLFLYIVHTI